MKKLCLAILSLIVLFSFANFVQSQELCDRNINLMFTIDNSGSLIPAQFNLIKSNSINFIDSFNSSVQELGLSSFGHTGVLRSGLTNNFVGLKMQIGSLYQDSQSGTNMVDGIRKSLNEIQSNGGNLSHYIILISDGMPNSCTDDSGNLTPFGSCNDYTLQKAQEAKNAGITIYTIGTNLAPGSAAETFMKSLASDDSKYFSSPDATNLNTIYSQIGTEICGGDTTAPYIISTIPLTNQINIPLNQNIIVTFSEPINPSTFNSNTFSLTDGTNVVSGSITVSGSIATFTPSSVLSPNTLYTALVTTGLTDLAGNHMENSYSWSFTTGSGTDTTAPYVVSTNPSNGDDNVNPNQNIVVTFNEPMNPSTFNSSTFIVSDGINNVAGTLNVNGNVVIFNPDNDFSSDTTYTITITSQVADLAGNHMLENYVFSFTTKTGNNDNNETCHKNTWQLNSNCEPVWNCGGWSECSDGTKTRTCNDINSCNLTYNKPLVSVGCDAPKSAEEVVKASINLPWLLILILIALILFVLLVIILVKK